MESITLRWRGPYSLDSGRNLGEFDPPDEPGVYLWTVLRGPEHPDSFMISYVGQASSIRNRMLKHISGILGGEACLYNDDHLFKGKFPDDSTKRYIPEGRNLLNKFVNEFEEYSVLARKNLASYYFFWAVMPNYRGREGAPFRMAVESALIEKTKNRLQNWRKEGKGISLSQAKSPHILIKSEFSDAKKLRELVEMSMNYGAVYEK